jgi:hypothetical protein
MAQVEKALVSVQFQIQLNPVYFAPTPAEAQYSVALLHVTRLIYRHCFRCLQVLLRPAHSLGKSLDFKPLQISAFCRPGSAASGCFSCLNTGVDLLLAYLQLIAQLLLLLLQVFPFDPQHRILRNLSRACTVHS